MTIPDTRPKTLLDLAGRVIPLPRFAEATLLLIDYQNEYVAGPLALPDAEAAIARTVPLLAAVRAAGGRVVHVAHAGHAGGPFDRRAERGAIVEALTPLPGEPVVEKQAVSAFFGTDLSEELGDLATRPLIVAGFMTHNCVSSTVRDAGDRGATLVVAHDACATRALPDTQGRTVPAEVVHAVSLVGLGDRFARLASVAEILAAG